MTIGASVHVLPLSFDIRKKKIHFSVSRPTLKCWHMYIFCNFSLRHRPTGRMGRLRFAKMTLYLKGTLRGSDGSWKGGRNGDEAGNGRERQGGRGLLLVKSEKCTLMPMYM